MMEERGEHQESTKSQQEQPQQPWGDNPYLDRFTTKRLSPSPGRSRKHRNARDLTAHIADFNISHSIRSGGGKRGRGKSSMTVLVVPLALVNRLGVTALPGPTNGFH